MNVDSDVQVKGDVDPSNAEGQTTAEVETKAPKVKGDIDGDTKGKSKAPKEHKDDTKSTESSEKAEGEKTKTSTTSTPRGKTRSKSPKEKSGKSRRRHSLKGSMDVETKVKNVEGSRNRGMSHSIQSTEKRHKSDKKTDSSDKKSIPKIEKEIGNIIKIPGKDNKNKDRVKVSGEPKGKVKTDETKVKGGAKITSDVEEKAKGDVEGKDKKRSVNDDTNADAKPKSPRNKRKKAKQGKVSVENQLDDSNPEAQIKVPAKPEPEVEINTKASSESSEISSGTDEIRGSR